MTKLALVNEQDPILTQSADPWNWDQDGEVADLAHQLLKTMFEQNGIGLAAPQCGIAKRIFVMGTPQSSYICVNPEIVHGTGKIKGEEGCLSYPGLYLHVNRFEVIQVRYQDIMGKTHEREFSNYMARVFQHEYEHLDGICFVNKVSKLSLNLAQRRRRKNMKRK